jgi:hypothetical protein
MLNDQAVQKIPRLCHKSMTEKIQTESYKEQREECPASEDNFCKKRAQRTMYFFKPPSLSFAVSSTSSFLQTAKRK